MEEQLEINKGDVKAKLQQETHISFFFFNRWYFFHIQSQVRFSTQTQFLSKQLFSATGMRKKKKRTLRLWRNIKPNFWDRWDSNPRRATASKNSFPEPDCSSLPEQKIDEPESGTSQGTEDGMFFFLWRKEEEERGEEPKRRKDERPPSTTETNPWKRKTERKWEWEWEGEGEREKVREGGGGKRKKSVERERKALTFGERFFSLSLLFSLSLSLSLLQPLSLCKSPVTTFVRFGGWTSQNS